jgi:hypothetical protein
MIKNKLIAWVVIILLPFTVFSQQATTLTGFWKGTLYNDTTGQTIPYEIAISYDNGKFDGYSYTLFKDEQGEQYGVKYFKLKKRGNEIIIEDINLVNDSYDDPTVKKVKKLMVLALTQKDSVWVLSGKWTTNWTSIYHPITGTIEVQKKNENWREEPLIKKLQELDLISRLSFYNPVQNNDQSMAQQTPETVKSKRLLRKEATTTPVQQVMERKITPTRNIPFESDSLQITLYDNGVVDGDTVSIFMNNALIFPRVGLSDKPFTRTVSTKGYPDSILLVMFADNLGSIPPNTGLMIIYDGKKRYEVYYSSDLQTNDAVILRRKKINTL